MVKMVIQKIKNLLFSSSPPKEDCSKKYDDISEMRSTKSFIMTDGQHPSSHHFFSYSYSSSTSSSLSSPSSSPYSNGRNGGIFLKELIKIPMPYHNRSVSPSFRTSSSSAPTSSLLRSFFRSIMKKSLKTRSIILSALIYFFIDFRDFDANCCDSFIIIYSS